jgi:hypothetical protein
MAIITRVSSMTLALAGILFAGCAGEGNGNIFTTGAIGGQPEMAAGPEPKVDPACVTLATRIDGLRREGIAEKIEKASLKKYKMTQADLSKADQLTKANAEFQMRCSNVAPRPTTAQMSSMPATAAPSSSPKAVTGKSPAAVGATAN